MRREIAASPVSPQLKRSYERRLSELAQEITRKQMIVLESGGQRFDWTVLLSDSLIAGTKTEALEDVELSLDSVNARFASRCTRWIRSSGRCASASRSRRPRSPTCRPLSQGASRSSSWSDLFNSPMIDNTRLSNDQRVAMVLTNLNNAGAGLSLVYFPGSRASLREKPYYEEILRKLAGQ